MKIGILGCGGRMGRALLSEVLGTDGCTLAGGTERPEHPALGQDLGVLAGMEDIGLTATEEAEALIAEAEAAVSYTHLTLPTIYSV